LKFIHTFRKTHTHTHTHTHISNKRIINIAQCNKIASPYRQTLEMSTVY